MESTCNLIRLLKSLGNAVNILQFYGTTNQCCFLMIFLCRVTKESWDKNEKAFISFLKKNKPEYNYNKEFDRLGSKTLLKDSEYSKYRLSLNVKSRESYKYLISFITRVPHLKFLSFSKIVCESDQGEYEWYCKLVDTFNTFKLDINVLQNKDLFKDCGKFYPKDRSLKYLNCASNIDELSTTQVCEHLNLADHKVFLKDYDFSTVKSSIKLSIKFVEYIIEEKININCTAHKLIVSDLNHDKIDDCMDIIGNFISLCKLNPKSINLEIDSFSMFALIQFIISTKHKWKKIVHCIEFGKIK